LWLKTTTSSASNVVIFYFLKAAASESEKTKQDKKIKETFHHPEAAAFLEKHRLGYPNPCFDLKPEHFIVLSRKRHF